MTRLLNMASVVLSSALVQTHANNFCPCFQSFFLLSLTLTASRNISFCCAPGDKAEEVDLSQL